MDQIIRKSKHKDISKAIIGGEEHSTHRFNKIISAKKQIIDFNCKCKPKCANVLTNDQKLEVFKRYYSLKSHNEQHLFLKSLLIPLNKANGRKTQKNQYFLESKSDIHEV
jgi:siroheme synthase (precorrin-2 oxidase/ferrochelatase)